MSGPETLSGTDCSPGIWLGSVHKLSLDASRLKREAGCSLHIPPCAASFPVGEERIFRLMPHRVRTAQLLEQILAQGSHDRPLPMLEESDVKRGARPTLDVAMIY